MGSTVPIQKDGLYHIASVERGAEHGIGQNEDFRLTATTSSKLARFAADRANPQARPRCEG
jgi:hypothetical protein